MKFRGIIAGALALVLSTATLAQTNQGASPQSVAKGGAGATTASQARTNLGVAIGTNVEAWDADLDCIAANSTAGIHAYTGAGTCAYRTLTPPAAGFTITNPAGTAGNPTFVLANDLGALEALASTGFAVRTTTDTWAQRTLQAPAAGFTITNPAGVAGDPTFVLANDLAALEGLSSTGIARRTGTDAWSVGTTVSVAEGGTGQTTAPAARASSGLNVDSFTGHGDSTYTILLTDRTVGTNAAFTASRTWTLPAANTVNAGQEIIVADFQGTVTASNTLVISRAGSDTVNGGTSVTMTSANGAYLLKSDGSSKWTAQALGAAAGGGISSVTCGTGLSGGTITTSGTCAVSGLSTNTPFTFSSGSSAGFAASTTGYAGIGAACASEAACMIPIALAGTFKSLYVQASTAVNPGNWIVTVRKNGISTALTCTIATNSCNDTTHSFSVAAGDIVDIQVVAAASSVTAFASFGLVLTTTSP